jgi:integrase/recombinase XerD
MEKRHFDTTPRTLPKFISKEEISSMLSHAKNESKKFSYRNYIILMTLSRTGMRADELVKLRKRDITESTIIVRQGKGKKDRVIPLDKELSGLLGLYTDRLTPKDKVFPISNRQVRNIVYKYAPRDLDVHPHTLRHSFAVHCLKSGMNIRSLQKILGHSNLNTTQVYLDVVGKDIVDDFEKVIW